MFTPSKFLLFLQNARLLQKSFDITPLLYGSLGLEYLTGEDLNSDDIDILIYEKYLTDRWDEFRATLEKEGYVLVDEHEHTFCKDGICYSYASIEELYSFAGIPLTKIGVKTEEDVKFRLLTLEQYQTVYRASSKDGYRVKVRNKKDKEKLKFIYKQIVKEQKKENPHPVLNALAEAGIELLLILGAVAIGLLVIWILPEHVDMPIEIAIMIGGFILAAIIGVFLLVDYFVRLKKKDKK
ncbi:MAG: hypothetical protein J6D27_03675 [Ruminiclostridium sp.]|nr:hypothetical protein [Ruminiclostridium sp.]